MNDDMHTSKRTDLKNRKGRSPECKAIRSSHIMVLIKQATVGNVLEVQSLPVQYFGGTRALFPYINIRINNSVGRTIQNFSPGGHCPTYLPASTTLVLQP